MVRLMPVQEERTVRPKARAGLRERYLCHVIRSIAAATPRSRQEDAYLEFLRCSAAIAASRSWYIMIAMRLSDRGFFGVRHFQRLMKKGKANPRAMGTNKRYDCEFR